MLLSSWPQHADQDALLEQAWAGDMPAALTLCYHYRPVMIEIGWLRTSGWAKRPDEQEYALLVDDVLLRCAEKLHAQRPTTAHGQWLRAWIWTCVKNRTTDLFRQWQGRWWTPLAGSDLAYLDAASLLRYDPRGYGPDSAYIYLSWHILDPDPTAEEQVLRAERHAAIRRVLVGCDPISLAAFALLYGQEMGLEEVGRLLGVTRTALKSRIHRTRQKLRAAIEADPALRGVLAPERQVA